MTKVIQRGRSVHKASKLMFEEKYRCGYENCFFPCILLPHQYNIHMLKRNC